jgi:hypothetical protein
VTLSVLADVMAWVALVTVLVSSYVSFVVNRRLLAAQGRAYDYAADVMTREFHLELAARHALAMWRLHPHAAREVPASNADAALVDALERLRAAVDEPQVAAP